MMIYVVSGIGAFLLLTLLVIAIWLVKAIFYRPTLIADTDDMLDETDMFMLAQVPRYNPAALTPGQVPRFALSDGVIPFEVLVRNVLWAALPQKCTQLLVTSPNYRSGKSFIAAHLAIALAERKHKVLLVDAHARRSGWEGLLPVADPPEGFVDTPWETGVEHLQAYRPEHVFSLEMLAQENHGYQYIIIDGPPVKQASVLLVNRTIRNVILVTAPQLTSYESFQAALTFLQAYPVRVLGYVMNQPLAGNSKKSRRGKKPANKAKKGTAPTGQAGIAHLQARLVELSQELEELRQQHDRGQEKYAAAMDTIRLQQETIDMYRRKIAHWESVEYQPRNGKNGKQTHDSHAQPEPANGGRARALTPDDYSTVFVPLEKQGLDK